MKERVEVNDNDSVHLEISGLVLSVRLTLGKECDVVVGYPGLPNEERRVKTGDAILYETPSTGMFEVRVLTQSYASVSFLITRIAPRLGVAGAFVTSDPSNAPFAADELQRIALSLDRVKDEISLRTDVLPEQVALIHRKLDEIKEASKRLGRKDWILYVAGTITSVCTSAAFPPEVTKGLFTSLNAAFSWLFGNALQLLQ